MIFTLINFPIPNIASPVYQDLIWIFSAKFVSYATQIVKNVSIILTPALNVINCNGKDGSIIPHFNVIAK